MLNFISEKNYAKGKGFYQSSDTRGSLQLNVIENNYLFTFRNNNEKLLQDIFILWANMTKNQSSSTYIKLKHENLELSSHCIFNDNKNFYIVFNDHIKNSNISLTDQPTKMGFNDVLNGANFLVSINSEKGINSIEKRKLFENSKIEMYPYPIYYEYEKSNNSLFLHCKKGVHYKIGLINNFTK